MRDASSSAKSRALRLVEGASIGVCFEGLLRLCLVLCLSGAFTTVHFILIPHKWCSVHHQLEHSEASTERIVAADHPRRTSLAINADLRGEAGANHEECTTALCHSPALASYTALVDCLPDMVRPVEVSFDGTLVVSDNPISFAPKRSPPDIPA